MRDFVRNVIIFTVIENVVLLILGQYIECKILDFCYQNVRVKLKGMQIGWV